VRLCVCRLRLRLRGRRTVIKSYQFIGEQDVFRFALQS
jgi:hypothetical protein